MNRYRTLLAIGSGFAVGMTIGPVSTLMLTLPWKSQVEFDYEYVGLLALLSLPAGSNGAIGAGLASRGNLNASFIKSMPLSMHVIALLGIFDGVTGFYYGQMVALMFSVIIWTAGRLGQSIGWALRDRSEFRVPSSEFRVSPDA